MREDLLNAGLTATAFSSDARGGALPSRAQVVIVGGGILGASVAFHLVRAGVKDVLLLERASVSAGTSWHAAGLIANSRGSHAMTELASYGVGLYSRLEELTGIDIGFNQAGAISLARTADRVDELRYIASVGRHHGRVIEELSPAEVCEHWPLAEPAGMKAGFLHAQDGTVNPGWTALALAKGAHDGGAVVREGVEVTRILHERGRATGVETTTGVIEADTVVLCGGMWSRELAAAAGVSLPLYAAEHVHVTTTPVTGAHPDLPVLRDLDGYFYARHYRGRLLVGAFEPDGRPRTMESLGEDFAFGEFEPDWGHFEPVRRKAVERLPVLESLQYERFLCAPESFTPDGNFLLGETAELGGLFTACGMNSQGVIFGAGAGKALAEWIVEGAPTIDSAEVDCTRFARTQNNPRYLHTRTHESLGRVFAMHWPHLQPESARGVRRGPLYERLLAAGACMGEATGWERANWYAPPGMAAVYEYSYGRQNWFDAVAAEHAAARERVAMFDLSSFAKIEVAGAGACELLQRACTQNVDVATGRVVYTLFCNPRGGIELDGTVARLGEDRFLVLTPGVTQHKTVSWLRRLAGPGAPVGVHDATSGYATLAVMGPSSRELLSRISPADLSNEAFPWGRAREIEIGSASALALRISFVGELGWELYIPTEYAVGVYDELLAASAGLGLAHAGYHALDSLRIEKGFRHLGHDIGPADDPYQSGLSFAVKLEKDFVGRAALARLAEETPSRRQVFIRLDDPEPILVGGEPIRRDGVPVGQLTSAAYGYTLGSATALGYVETAAAEDGPIAVEVAGRMEPAVLSTTPFYDPDSLRMRDRVPVPIAS
jgi:glycine cleavage system aminomethyltransferase T/glycine/D-amino acid oxidase-like deaminating enzyme